MHKEEVIDVEFKVMDETSYDSIFVNPKYVEDESQENEFDDISITHTTGSVTPVVCGLLGTAALTGLFYMLLNDN